MGIDLPGFSNAVFGLTGSFSCGVEFKNHNRLSSQILSSFENQMKCF